MATPIDKKQIVSLEELLMSQVVQQEAKIAFSLFSENMQSIKRKLMIQWIRY